MYPWYSTPRMMIGSELGSLQTRALGHRSQEVRKRAQEDATLLTLIYAYGQ